MNQNELEDWIRQRLEDRSFPPGEAGWLRLQDALPPAGQGRRQKRLPLLLRTGIAASLVLLLATVAYVALQDPPHATVRVAGNGAPPAAQQQQRPGTKTPPVAGSNESGAAQLPPTARAALRRAHPAKPQAPAAQQSPMANRDTIALAAAVPAPDKTTIPVHRAAPSQPGTEEQPDHADMPSVSRRLDLGVAVQVGQASVGKMNYQAGVVLRKQISGKVYAESAMLLAATDVQYTQQHTFRHVVLSPTGNSSGSETVNATYRNNIVSLGITPALGYQVLPRVRVSAGAIIYCNLNRSLRLSDQAGIDSMAISSDIIGRSQSVNLLDVGLTGRVAWQLGDRFSLSAQYRYGLTPYIYNNSSIRYSGMNAGLQYSFKK